MKPTTADAYQLLHNGSLALAKMEANGFRVDVDYLNRAIQRVDKKIADAEAELKAHKIYRLWRRRFGDRTKLAAVQQMGHVFYNELGYEVLKYTEKSEFSAKKVPSTKQEDMVHIKDPFLELYFRWKNLEKTRTTYLGGIRNEVVDGFIHADFSLHKVVTYRGSCSSPNLTNVPIRDPEMGKTIRRCFIPRDGHVLAEIDYGALEFSVAADFWPDSKMREYASDPTKDIHRDMAAKLYKLPAKLVTKKLRYFGKNGFVFPTLYGSFYKQIAKYTWHELPGEKLADGTLVLDHLKRKGIKELGACDFENPPQPGTYEAHVKKVEEWFYNEFHEFKNAKDKWLSDYRAKGGFPLMTGFWISGVYSRNFLLNCPIQGPGYHLLLWSQTEIQRELERRKFRAKIVCTIHDCLVIDSPVKELQDVLHLCKEVMTRKVMRHWDWIVVPKKAEVDVTPQDCSWHEKAPWNDDSGKWQPTIKA